METVIWLLAVPFWILAGMFGHYAGHSYLMWHKPYEWRVKYGPKSGGWAPGIYAVPTIPKDRWW